MKARIVIALMMFVLVPSAALVAENHTVADSAIGANGIEASLIGKRVKVHLQSGLQILGTVKTVQETQILLVDAKPNPVDPPSEVLIDTSSGAFAYLQIIDDAKPK